MAVVLQMDIEIFLFTDEIRGYICQSEEETFGSRPPLIVHGSVLLFILHNTVVKDF